MTPRERITTILFIEQLKNTRAENHQRIKYNELTQRKDGKLNGNMKKHAVIVVWETLKRNTVYRLAPFATETAEILVLIRKSGRFVKKLIENEKEKQYEKSN